jgi:hypothetical protein
MNKPTSNASTASDLEKMLDSARKEKTLAQVPALRRLRTIVRALLILGVLGQYSIIAASINLSRTIEVLSGIGTLAPLLVGIMAVLTPATMALNWLQLVAYARFLKQFRLNHVTEIKNTSSMMVRLYGYALLVAVLLSPLSAIVAQAELQRQIAGRELDGQFWIVLLTTVLLGLAFAVILYLVLRRYVKAAQAELPRLISAFGPDAPEGNYRKLKPLFLALWLVAGVFCGVSYFVMR